MTRKIQLLDSTLRDGAQGKGINFSIQDKIHIVQALDELGIDFIEAGNPASNPKDMDFFQKVKKLSLKKSKIVAFGSTRHKDFSCQNDTNIQSLLSCECEHLVIFGKTWDFQASNILQVSLDENLKIIEETISYFVKQGRKVIFDAEHFFSGYKSNPEYALKCLTVATDAGASCLCLCETKGACMLKDTYQICTDVVNAFGNKNTIGIHTHNDSGLAVANSLLAVECGISHVQGVLLGYGERTGNANLSTIIPDLQIKMNYDCVDSSCLEKLTPICKRVAEITNISLSSNLPYVGQNAFAHKAGMHVDAVLKSPESYEHVNPVLVGNERVFLVSEVAGRSLIVEKLKGLSIYEEKNTPLVNEIFSKIKELEYQGYQYEAAEASLDLLILKIIGKYKPGFSLHYYKTMGDNPIIEDNLYSYAQLKIAVGDHVKLAAGEGNGPVNALDLALRSALKSFYPFVEDVHLIDYKVRVLDGKSATASRVRVLIETTDGKDTWTTIGVSCDIVEASWLALVDSYDYKLMKEGLWKKQ